MKYLIVVLLFAIISLVLMSLRSLFPKPDVSLKFGNFSYDFTNRQAYADVYAVKSVVDDCNIDTCYQEHEVKVYYLKRDVVTNEIIEKGQTSTYQIAAVTAPTTTFIGKLLINDYRHYYEYYVEDGKSYKAINTKPLTMRYFPNKHLLDGHYAIQFPNDSCFKGVIEIFRGASATDNAKLHNQKVRVYFEVALNGQHSEQFSVVFPPDASSMIESLTFVNTPQKECNFISFYQVTDVEAEQ